MIDNADGAPLKTVQAMQMVLKALFLDPLLSTRKSSSWQCYLKQYLMH